MKKVFLMLTLCGIYSLAHAANSDPCDHIQGNWSGKIYYKYCTWKVKSQVEKYEKTVRISLQSEPGEGGSNCGSKIIDVLTGTCKDALINLQHDVVGSIFNDSMVLQGQNGARVEMTKDN